MFLLPSLKNLILRVARVDNVRRVYRDGRGGENVTHAATALTRRHVALDCPVGHGMAHIEVLSQDDRSQLRGVAMHMRVTTEPTAPGHIHETRKTQPEIHRLGADFDRTF